MTYRGGPIARDARRTDGANVKPWKFSQAPAFSYKVKGGRKVVDLYDQCHKAWRAGLIESWYYGMRSPGGGLNPAPRDTTIIWELNGREFDPETLAQTLATTLFAQGITAIEWGPMFCGYRELSVSYADGRVLCERFDGTAVVLEETAKAQAA